MTEQLPFGWDQVLRWQTSLPYFFREPRSECHNARVARERQQREAEEQRQADLAERLATELAVAQRTWQFAHTGAIIESVPLLAVVNLHHPVIDYDRVVCDHCEEHDGYEGTQSVAWPCGTWVAMQEAR